MRTELLKDFAARVLKEGLEVRGVAVRQHGRVLDVHDFEEPAERVQLFSASKTWTAMAIGIAEGEGLLKLTDKLTDILKDELPDKVAPGIERVTVRNLLTMSTGHGECPAMKVMREMRERGEMPERGLPRGDAWFNAFFETPLRWAPEEEHFLYNNAATYMLSCIITKLTGLPLRDYLMPRVFLPLQIEDPQWDADSKGRSLGALGLHLTTEELSRAGQLLLNKGAWEGRQLVPEAYAVEMGKKQVENDYNPEDDIEARQGYGYQTWRCTFEDAYRLDGMGGQYSIQLPHLDAVVATTSHRMEHTCDILRAVRDTIVPKLRELY